MNAEEVAETSFDWANEPRRKAMVRFGPIIGLSVLQLNETFSANRQQDMYDFAQKECAFEAKFKDLEPLDLIIILNTACLWTLDDKSLSKFVQFEPDAAKNEVLKKYHIDKLWHQEQNLFWPYNRTLKNSYVGMFVSVGYCLELLDKCGQVKSAATDMNTTLTTLKQPWFPEFLRDVASAPQFFWKIPDPDIVSAVDFKDHINERLTLLSTNTHLPVDQLLIRQGDLIKLNPKVKAMIAEERTEVKINEIAHPKADSNGVGWAHRTSSGCPVRHKRIGHKAIEETFTPEQITEFENAGVLNETDEGYELFDFMKFTAGFVAKHLENLYEQVKCLTRAEEIPETVQN